MPRNRSKQKSRARKTKRKRSRYQCSNGHRFNNKKNDGCPNCGSKHIKLLGKKPASATTNRAGRRY